jgi:Family of unknown function (DUF6011)
MNATSAPLQTVDVLDFITGGKAIFTLQSKVSGSRFTFKATQVPDGGDKYFVSVLNGPDNYANYQYIGMIGKGDVAGVREFYSTKNSRVSTSAPSFKAFAWFFRTFQREPLLAVAQCEIFHEGKCCRCGRKLTTPESITRGIGPECAKRD